MEIQKLLLQAQSDDVEYVKQEIDQYTQLYHKHLYDKMGKLFREIKQGLEGLLEHEVKEYEAARSEEVDRLGAGNAADVSKPDSQARDVFIKTNRPK